MVEIPEGWKLAGDGKLQFEGPCEACGSIIRRYPYQFRSKRQLCSKKCLGVVCGAIPGSVRWRRGRAWVYRPDHPFATNMAKMVGYILRSRDVAERAFGRMLPEDACFHHVNEDPTDDRPGNLLICDRSFHRWLHVQIEKMRYGTIARWRE